MRPLSRYSLSLTSFRLPLIWLASATAGNQVLNDRRAKSHHLGRFGLGGWYCLLPVAVGNVLGFTERTARQFLQVTPEDARDAEGGVSNHLTR
jgi:hypothetical protein